MGLDILYRMEPWFTKRHKDRLVSVKLSYRKETIEGVVLDFSEAWVLLAAVIDYRLDGYMVLRNHGIVRITMGDRERFTERVLSQRGVQVIAPNGIPLDGLEGLLSALTDRYGVFGLYEEREDMWWLGALQSYSAKSLVINDLDPRGFWNTRRGMRDVRIGPSRTRRFQPWRIRMVEFESDYIKALKFIDQLRQTHKWDAKAKLKFTRPVRTPSPRT